MAGSKSSAHLNSSSQQDSFTNNDIPFPKAFLNYYMSILIQGVTTNEVNQFTLQQVYNCIVYLINFLATQPYHITYLNEIRQRLGGYQSELRDLNIEEERQELVPERLAADIKKYIPLLTQIFNLNNIHVSSDLAIYLSNYIFAELNNILSEENNTSTISINHLIASFNSPIEFSLLRWRRIEEDLNSSVSASATVRITHPLLAQAIHQLIYFSQQNLEAFNHIINFINKKNLREALLEGIAQEYRRALDRGEEELARDFAHLILFQLTPFYPSDSDFYLLLNQILVNYNLYAHLEYVRLEEHTTRNSNIARKLISLKYAYDHDNTEVQYDLVSQLISDLNLLNYSLSEAICQQLKEFQILEDVLTTLTEIMDIFLSRGDIIVAQRLAFIVLSALENVENEEDYHAIFTNIEDSNRSANILPEEYLSRYAPSRGVNTEEIELLTPASNTSFAAQQEDVPSNLPESSVVAGEALNRRNYCVEAETASANIANMSNIPVNIVGSRYVSFGGLSSVSSGDGHSIQQLGESPGSFQYVSSFIQGVSDGSRGILFISHISHELARGNSFELTSRISFTPSGFSRGESFDFASHPIQEIRSYASFGWEPSFPESVMERPTFLEAGTLTIENRIICDDERENASSTPPEVRDVVYPVPPITFAIDNIINREQTIIVAASNDSAADTEARALSWDALDPPQQIAGVGNAFFETS